MACEILSPRVQLIIETLKNSFSQELQITFQFALLAAKIFIVCF